MGTMGIPNPQYDYDHRNDSALFLDSDFVSRKLRAMQGAYEKYKELAVEQGGPAVVEIFGTTPFAPSPCEQAAALSEKQQKLQVHMNNEASQIVNRYVREKNQFYHHSLSGTFYRRQFPGDIQGDRENQHAGL